MTKILSITASALSLVLAAFNPSIIPVVAAEGLNVYGDDLQPCSQDGMALTGFTRTGLCDDYDEDAGSHNVCINMPSSSGGNFCTVTGQPNWCDETSECHEDTEKDDCPVEHWCVCEWAFAGYLETAGGYDKVAEIVCESTNEKVILHYEKAIKEKEDGKYKEALSCLKQRCGTSIHL